jgi:hypothetical protein
MNGKKRNLRSNNEAVSGVIGAVLLMAIAVTMLTMFQASMVPYWNKQVEAAEIKVTYDDMMFLPSDIEDVAIHETPKTCTVQLGAQYPDRMIFRNPGPGAAGTLTVEEVPAPINVTYNNGTTYTEHYDSCRITYELSGTINSPKLVYEHGVIITDWGTASVTTDEQKLIENDDIYIPIVNGSSLSKSAIGVESIAIKPYEYLDTLADISNVSVTLDTDYPEVWWGLLEDYIDQGMVSISNQSKKIYINTSVPYLKLPNQTASGSLHAGMIYCSVEDPDGGGNGGGGGGGDWHYGAGEDKVAHGSLWDNIPSSDNITQFDLTDIIVDESIMDNILNCDFIIIQVTDYQGDWWRAQVNFDWHDGGPHGDDYPRITTIIVQARGEAEDSKTLNAEFDTSTTINFLSTSWFPHSCYQNANIDYINTLHVEISEVSAPGQERGIALKYFTLIIA